MNSVEIQRFVTSLCKELALKDLGPLHYFHGIEVVRTHQRLFLCQNKYAKEIVIKSYMLDSKVSTLWLLPPLLILLIVVILMLKLTIAQLGSPQYLTFTRLDLSQSVNIMFVNIFKLLLRKIYELSKEFCRYIQGTMNYGLPIFYVFCDAEIELDAPNKAQQSKLLCLFWLKLHFMVLQETINLRMIKSRARVSCHGERIC